jgi:Tfp pilus assembly major pilin PilA
MKVQVKFADGNPSRVRLYDAASGVKLGLVKSFELKITIGAATMRYSRGNTKDDEVVMSPWLIGKETTNGSYVFDVEG